MDLFIRYAMGAAELAVADSAIPRAISRATGPAPTSARDRRARLDRGEPQGPPREGARPGLPFFLIQTIINEALRPDLHPLRRQGPQLRQCHRLQHRVARHRGLLPDHRRGDADIMITGGARRR